MSLEFKDEEEPKELSDELIRNLLGLGKDHTHMNFDLDAALKACPDPEVDPSYYEDDEYDEFDEADEELAAIEQECDEDIQFMSNKVAFRITMARELAQKVIEEFEDNSQYVKLVNFAKEFLGREKHV